MAESCATKVFLPNFEANNETQRGQHQSFGLNSKQINIIAQATPKRDYYVFSRSGRRLMQLALGPKALAFVGASGKEDIAKARELASTQADKWPEAWLDYKQLA